jgi:hypothetical protein
MFIEEDPTEPRSLCKAAIGQYGSTYYIILLYDIIMIVPLYSIVIHVVRA